MSSADAPVVPFFKKKAKASTKSGNGGTATKKRAASPTADDEQDKPRASTSSFRRNLDGDDDGDSSSVVRLAKKEAYNPLKQGTSSYKRRKQGDEDDNDDELGYGNREDGVSVSYTDRTARRTEKRSASPADDVLTGDAALAKVGETGDDGLYHGASAYTTGLAKPVPGESKFAPIKGPSASIKTITITDYQAGLCKDFRETGWCGFGDSCCFAHVREDYQQGWELDNAFLSNQAKKDIRLEENRPEEEELPFACIICREPFSDPPHDPVVTRCGHYFGSSCAIKRFRKTPKCYACGASTGGMFNKATKILERKEKAQKERIRKREEDEKGQGGYGEEEEEKGVEIEGLGEE